MFITMGAGHSSSFGRSSNLNEAATASRTNSRSPCQHHSIVGRNSIETLHKFVFDGELSPHTTLDKRNLPVEDDEDELESSSTTDTSLTIDSPELYHFVPCRMFPKVDDEFKSNSLNAGTTSSRIPVVENSSKISDTASANDEDDDPPGACDDDIEHLKRMYDRRTWNMYVRIMAARERSKARIPAQVIAYGNAATSSAIPHCHQHGAIHEHSNLDQQKSFTKEYCNYHSHSSIEVAPASQDDGEETQPEDDLIFGEFE